MKDSFKKKVAKSSLWISLDVGLQKVMQFIISIVLARILSPEEFGILGLTAVLISFSMILIDSGFSFGLIRKKDVIDEEYNVVFWFNLVVSIFLYFFLFFTASFVADFYSIPILSKVIIVLSLTLIVNSLGSVQNVKLNREMRFRELTIIGITSKLLSGLIGIYLALKGFGVWSLVYQQLSMSIIKTLMLFYYNMFIPKLNFSWYYFKQLFSFSSKLLYGSISYIIVGNLYPIIIGKFYNIYEVGFFDRAKRLQRLPVDFFMQIVRKITLPTFAKIQDDNLKFKYYYEATMKTSVFLILFPLLFFIISAYPLIEFLLTSKWLPVAPILQILCIGAVFFPLSALNVNIIGIKNRSDLIMYLQFLKDGVAIISIVIGSFFGLKGLIWSFVFTSLIGYILNVYFVNKVIEYPLWKQIKSIVPAFIIGIISSIIVYTLDDLILFSNLFQQLFFNFFVLLVLYFGFAFIFKLNEIKFLKELMKSLK